MTPASAQTPGPPTNADIVLAKKYEMQEYKLQLRRPKTSQNSILKHNLPVKSERLPKKRFMGLQACQNSVCLDVNSSSFKKLETDCRHQFHNPRSFLTSQRECSKKLELVAPSLLYFEFNHSTIIFGIPCPSTLESFLEVLKVQFWVPRNTAKAGY